MLALLLAADSTGSDPRLWALVAALTGALGTAVKILVTRYDRLQTRYETLQDKSYSALGESVVAMKAMITATQDLAGSRQLQRDLDQEREQRIRAEERSRYLEETLHGRRPP